MTDHRAGITPHVDETTTATTADGVAQDVARTGSELAYHAAVSAETLAGAVRTIDRCLFMLFADQQMSAAPDRSPFAPDAITEMAGDLELAARQMDVMAARLSTLGGESMEIASVSADTLAS